MPTDEYNEFVDCTIPDGPKVVNCGYDSAGEVLSFLLPNVENSTVTEIAERDLDWQSQGVLKKFNQKEFVDLKLWKFSGFDDFGYVFYP